jgi:hypothetical protein
MPRQRFVQPDVDTIPLSDGDTITVKRRLNQGERTERLARMYHAGVDGTLHVNPTATDMSTVLAYLVDWTFADPSGKRVAIDPQSPAELEKILNNLDPDDFKEVLRAIEGHEDAVAARRAAEKKTRSGAPPAETTSSSPSVSDGTSNGSATLTPTTTPSS